jgi:leader peptidase (prepilin peptidase)/N-methyltransferase
MTVLFTIVLFALLVTAAVIDSRSMRIPNALNAVIAGVGIAATLSLDRPLIDALLGMALGYGLIYLANAAYRALRARDGIGMGDAKLLGAAGAWLGWAALPFVVLIASTGAIIWLLARRVMGHRIEGAQALPFGPALCVGIMVVWLVQAFAAPAV